MALWTPTQHAIEKPVFAFEAWDESTLTLNGSGVLNWADKGTDGIDAYQTNTAAQPQLIPNALNGKPIIRFATGQRLLFPSTRQLINKTIILVWKNNGGGSPLGIGASRVNAGTTLNIFSTSQPYNNTGNQTTANNIGSGFGIGHIGLHNTLEFYINGVKDPVNPTRTNASELWNYNAIVNTSFNWLADLAAIYLLPAEPSEAERQRYEGYLAHQLGITSRLLPGHPYFNTPPVTEIVVPVRIPNALDGWRYRIWNSDRDAEIENELVTGGAGIDTTFIADDDSVPHLEGDTIVVDITYPATTTAYLPSRVIGEVSSAGISGFVEQVPDVIYNLNGFDGSAETDMVADFTQSDLDFRLGQNFYGTAIYAKYVHTLHTEEGIRKWLGGMTAIDEGNYRFNVDIVRISIDNVTDTEIWQLDNVRVFNSDGSRPARHVTTGGGGIDMQWRSQVYVVYVGGSALTPTESAKLMSIPSNPLTAPAFLALK